MTPTAAGRHCAACQRTVVDFTHKTNAEILAYLAGAATSRTCGRFAAEQLERPLQRAAPAAPKHWRAWLAAVVAVWGLRESLSTPASAQAATEWQARYGGGPAPASPGQRAAEKSAQDSLRANTVIRGVVLDSARYEGLPGVTVLLDGTTIYTSTAADGGFELRIPAGAACVARVRFSGVGYVEQTRVLPINGEVQTIQTVMNTQVLGEMQVCYAPRKPWLWHPRCLYSWGKYWLTRPFRR
ncbi:MAG TPA: carboxypeptidase-like regulatory domain-containing protein [Hymenobacter sp.]|jgi:hypothetical protein